MITKLMMIISISFVSYLIPTAGFAGCQSNCDGIPAGKCSCVTIDYSTCCGLRTDGLKANTTNTDAQQMQKPTSYQTPTTKPPTRSYQQMKK